MTPETHELLARLAHPDVEVRYKATREIYYLPGTELAECFDALCAALSDTGVWMEYSTDEWGGYVDIANRPIVLTAQAIAKTGNPAGFIPLLDALTLPHHEDGLYWISWAMNKLPLPAFSPDLELRLVRATQAMPPAGPNLVRDVLQKYSAGGKNWRNLVGQLEHDEHMVRAVALTQLSSLRIKGEEARKLVAELRKYLQRENCWNPVGVFYTIWDFATADEMVETLLDDFLNRPELKTEIPDDRLHEVGHAFNMLGYWMGSNSKRAIPRMCEILRQVKNRLNDKELADWYTCLIKITNEPPREIVADMLELYDKAHEWTKDSMLTDLQYVYSALDLMEPFFEKHKKDKTPALGDTTTIGERIHGILRDRKMWST